MHNAPALTLLLAILTGCASHAAKDSANGESAERSHSGKVIGGAGGAVAGGAMAYSSAGILCAMGGPLCAIVVIPAAIIGGVLGLVAGSVADAVSNATAASPPDAAALPRADTSEPPGG